jgi:hypothetical protein
MGFGMGQFRREKQVRLLWSGDGTPAVRLGLGCIVALYYCSSTSYQIH